MRNITTAFRRALAEGRRDYTVRVVITLADSTVLNGTITTYDDDTGEETVTSVPYLTNENIWTDGLEIDDATSADNVFQIGTAIINQCKVVINNMYDTYSPYDFTGAVVVPYVGMKNLDDGTNDEVRMGTFNVDEASYDAGLITLTCLDNMVKFDKPYAPYSQSATSLNVLVNAACTACGVTAGPSAIDFPNKTHQVRDSVVSDATTYRQVISWIAQLAGCNARCDANGYLTFGFYNFDGLEEAQDNLDGGVFDSASPYASGDTADGGSFSPWNTGYVYDSGGFVGGYGSGVHFISSDFSSRVMVDDVVITGIRVTEKVLPDFLSSYANEYSSSSTYSKGAYAYYDNTLYQCVSAITSPEDFNRDRWSSVSVMTYTAGTEGYVIGIENNDFIQAGYGQAFANTLNNDLSGRTFRPCSITHPNNPSIEAGDVALFWDRKQNRYPIIVSSTTFAIGTSQNTTSSAETPARNSAQRFSEATVNYVELRKQIEQQKDYLTERLEGASGLYETYTTDVQTGSGQIYHYHDKPLLSDSNIVMKFTTAGFALTADYQTPASQGGPTWYGMTVDGQFIASILSVSGINADWINTGSLSANYISGGVLTLGGLNDVNGYLEIYNAQGQLIGSWKNGGITSKSLTATDYISINAGTGSFLKFPLSFPDRYDGHGAASGYMQLDNANGFVVSITPDGTSYHNDYNIGKFFDLTSTNNNQMTRLSNGMIQIQTSNSSQWSTIGVAGFSTNGSITATNTGNKHAAVETEDYNTRLLYSYETAAPMFGDIGDGTISDDGKCYISIDPVFAKTITNNKYYVFLQTYGDGECYVSERMPSGFIVEGTSGLQFAWEIKARQVNCDHRRLEIYDTEQLEVSEPDYAYLAIEHINDITSQRTRE